MENLEKKLILKHTSIFGIRIIRYRIVSDGYLGYECQKWRIWFPFWIQMNFTNTHSSLERAVHYINNGSTILES